MQSCVHVLQRFDDFSKPVPLEEMKKRLIFWRHGDVDPHDQWRGAAMHPDLDEVIRHMRRRGMIAGLITNGFYLNRERMSG